LKSLCADFEKYAAARKMKSESLINDKKIKWFNIYLKFSII
jgi:hypothetical protein